jgi:hypothetical protein
MILGAVAAGFIATIVNFMAFKFNEDSNKWCDKLEQTKQIIFLNSF